jgi:hypothetical protein
MAQLIRQKKKNCNYFEIAIFSCKDLSIFSKPYFVQFTLLSNEINYMFFTPTDCVAEKTVEMRLNRDLRLNKILREIKIIFFFSIY